MAWHTYMLRCQDGTLYTGITTDIEKRIAKHNLGTAAKYTRSRGPVEVVWHEPQENESTARKREIEIKKLTRQEKLDFLSSPSCHP